MGFIAPSRVRIPPSPPCDMDPLFDAHCSMRDGSKRNDAPVAQLDRVPDYESGGRRFESSRARQIPNPSSCEGGFFASARSDRSGDSPLPAEAMEVLPDRAIVWVPSRFGGHLFYCLFFMAWGRHPCSSARDCHLRPVQGVCGLCGGGAPQAGFRRG